MRASFFIWLMANPDAAVKGLGIAFAVLLAVVCLVVLFSSEDWVTKVMVVGIYGSIAVASFIWPFWGGVAAIAAAIISIVYACYKAGKKSRRWSY